MKNLSNEISIREASSSEYSALGEMTVNVYAGLPNMPGPNKMPEYYSLLQEVGARAQTPTIKIFVAVNKDNELLGGVTFVGDMKHYASGGTATSVNNSSGFRLLVVDPKARGLGVGSALAQYCIEQAKQLERQQIVIHTTRSMQVAWGMYERMGFQRKPEIDFKQGALQVYGFSLQLTSNESQS